MPKKKTTKQPARRAGGEAVCVALLRGVNVGGNKKVPMADLRTLATGLGWQQVETFIQSGNVVFRCDGDAPRAERELEQAIARRFGFEVPVVVRTGDEWLALAVRSAFADAESARPAALHLGVAKQPPSPGAAREIQPYARAGERVAIRGGAIWIDFAGGVAKSKLTAAVLDRAVGSTVTLRNWRTVQQLAEMVRAAAPG